MNGKPVNTILFKIADGKVTAHGLGKVPAIQITDAAVPARLTNSAELFVMCGGHQTRGQPADSAGTVDAKHLPPLIKSDTPGISGSHMTFQEWHQTLL